MGNAHPRPRFVPAFVRCPACGHRTCRFLTFDPHRPGPAAYVYQCTDQGCLGGRHFAATAPPKDGD